MGRVYSQARRVLVWLGRDDKGNGVDIFRNFQILHEQRISLVNAVNADEIDTETF
jgi:hypothetical protein